MLKIEFSDISQVFEVDAITGLKSNHWAGVGKLVNTPGTVQLLEYDITTN